MHFKKLILSIAAAVASAAPPLFAGTPETPPQEPGRTLLFSSGFDTDADKWKLNEYSRIMTEDGVTFLRLEASVPDKHICIYRRLYMPKGEALPAAIEVRVKARSLDIVHGKKKWNSGRLLLKFKDASEKTAKPSPKDIGFSGTSGWKESSYVFPVPENAYYLEIMPYMLQAQSGILDFAKIEIYSAPKSMLPKPPPPRELIPSSTITPPDVSMLPPPLRVKGNKIVDDAGKEIWLQGVCLDSMQWAGGGEHILESLPVAIDVWKANVIRLPVTEEFWAGRNKWQRDGGMKYRALVDKVIEESAKKGVYVVIDLHRFHAPTKWHVEFWKDVATRYKNHPAVIFELFNEPHSLSWKVWRDGGLLSGKENVNTDKGLAENNEKSDSGRTVGMQALLDAVRSAGAENPVIAGGLDWGYDLSGVASGEFALKDTENGRGIIYSSHVYPWKSGWKKSFMCAMDKYPLFIGELGNIRSWDDFSFIPKDLRREKVGTGSSWPVDMLGVIQKNKLNWTAFSFHPKCGPQLLESWDYTPTAFWGVYAKDALGGKQFTTEKLR